MKKLNITKDKFTESKYFTTKYGKLEYVSESGDTYKTSKGHVIQFVNEALDPMEKEERAFIKKVKGIKRNMQPFFDILRIDDTILWDDPVVQNKSKQLLNAVKGIGKYAESGIKAYSKVLDELYFEGNKFYETPDGQPREPSQELRDLVEWLDVTR